MLENILFKRNTPQEMKEFIRPSWPRLYLFGPLPYREEGSKAMTRAKRRIDFINFLSDCGYKTGIVLPIMPTYIEKELTPGEKREITFYDDYARFVDLSLQKIPSLKTIEMPMVTRKYIEWLDDAFLCLDEYCFLNPQLGQSRQEVSKVLENLLPKGIKIEASALGEGGRIVTAGKIIFLSKTIPEKEGNQFREKGYQVVFLPEDKRVDRNCFDHINTWLTAIENKKGEVMVIADHFYAMIPQVDKVLKEIKKSGVLVQNTDGRALLVCNLIIPLNDGRVILPPVDFKAKGKIIDFMGKDNILEVPFMPSREESLNLLGSWRCSFAEVYCRYTQLVSF